jgi:hypothetical protein
VSAAGRARSSLGTGRAGKMGGTGGTGGTGVRGDAPGVATARALVVRRRRCAPRTAEPQAAARQDADRHSPAGPTAPGPTGGRREPRA